MAYYLCEMDSITESNSRYDQLETKSTLELLVGINTEDKSVPFAVEEAIPAIKALVDAIAPKMQAGGRLFYMGAGTSGRLGVVDASECPPTFGVEHGLVVGLIAGGDKAIRYPVENAEDNTTQGWMDLQEHAIGPLDSVIGIAASGTTPYVIGALKECNLRHVLTGCITCNPNSPLAQTATYPIVAVVGPEFITGSTRMKSGTAQKLILNMISTALMIKLGRVKGNKMVDMQLSNHKLVNRGTRMVMEQTGADEPTALKLLQEAGSVRKAVELFEKSR
jgi:N-acetylmuramic acid 6-phosphate etherase